MTFQAVGYSERQAAGRASFSLSSGAWLAVPALVVASALLSLYVHLLQQSVVRGQSLRTEQRLASQDRSASMSRRAAAIRQLEPDALALAVVGGR